MSHLLQTLYYTGGFSGRNEWLTFEPDVDQLRALRKRVTPELGTEPASGLELLLSLRHYVHTKLTHHESRQAERLDAFYLLDLAEQGVALRCVEHGTLLCQVYQAFGIPARRLGIQAPEPYMGVAKGHVLCEVWWDEAGKWVVMDSQFDAHWEAGGQVLSALEVHNYVMTGRVQELAWVFAPTARPEELPSKGETLWWAQYFTNVGYTRGADFMSRPVRKVGSPGVDYLDPRVPPQFLFEGIAAPGMLEPDPSVVWFDCNRVMIQVESIAFPAGGKAQLKLRLTHCTPWFERFDVKATGEVVEHEGGLFTWTVNEEQHSFSAKTVNAFGRSGQATSLGLMYVSKETMAKVEHQG